MLLMGNSTISMVIFNSYVKLPEGTRWQNQHFDKNMGLKPAEFGNNVVKTMINYPWLGMVYLYHL